MAVTKETIFRVVSLLSFFVISIVGMEYKPTFETRPWADFMTTILIMPAKFECFFQDAGVGNSLAFEFELSGKDRRPSLSGFVKSPTGLVLYNNDNTNVGTFYHTAEVTGTYQFCIGNNHQKYYPKYVKMYLAVTDKQRMKDYYKLEEGMQKSLGNMSSTLQTLTMRVRTMRRYQQWSGIREKNDRELLEANKSYVTVWSSIQCLVIVGAAFIQVYTLRSLFNTAKLTPSQKPRC
ncbi:transmembrane emp24 domain-containing protein 6-like [Diadema antillarum]|uniref:transmembrane emp24 domain-containing protein 6-like n=1 Tax=Diadema antillarum TaxID=105358 RepID=UPI003A83BBEF